jgi:UDP-N-acetylglucosamine 2-epimerase (non-hydrolysing)/GDP/UDP-N,N'-diacetylbacillosamine 2-epimerase (hydrolysing)
MPEFHRAAGKVCVVTGSRADYGLLYWPLRRLQAASEFELQLVVTGSHLVADFGFTVARIEEDGFPIAARVDMLLAADSPAAVTRSLGLGVIGFADTLERLAPDLLLVLGDRYEILAATQAALVAGIPIAHLCGGDRTEGAFDDAIRHAVSKMAHLHFPSNEDAARRLRQMGEAPERVHAIGSPGLDHLETFLPLAREAFFAEVGLEPHRPTLLLAFHPVTLEGESLTQMEALLAALDTLAKERADRGGIGVIATGSNADPEGRRLSRRLAEYAAERPHAVFHPSLGQRLFWNALHHADVMVGNSSAGLYEAPSFATATVNLGERQRGRLRAASVIDCEPRQDAVLDALHRALELDGSGVVNPYGDGRASVRLLEVLEGIGDFRALLTKRFHDMEGAS